MIIEPTIIKTIPRTEFINGGLSLPQEGSFIKLIAAKNTEIKSINPKTIIPIPI